ncbi:MAG: fumarylacetoacetate hydrolase family protein [Bdellovibrio sp.]
MKNNSPATLQKLAQKLLNARRSAEPVDQLSTELSFSSAEAYEIQRLQMLEESAGQGIFGWKMGLTSLAKRQQMNLHEPVYGYLLPSMQVKEAVSLQGLIHPKVEPEIAFLVNRDIQGPLTYEQASQSIDAVAPALEILDSRYKLFRYFSLQDVIADNSSSSRFVLGDWRRHWRSLDLKNLDLEISLRGRLQFSEKASAISGDPVISLVQLTQLLSDHGLKIEAGQCVLAGAATAAVELQTGQHFNLDVGGLGACQLEVRP